MTKKFKDPSPAAIEAQATAVGLGIDTHEQDIRPPSNPQYKRLKGKCERLRRPVMYTASQWKAGTLTLNAMSGAPLAPIPVTGKAALVGELRAKIATVVPCAKKSVILRSGGRRLEDAESVGPADVPTLSAAVYPEDHATAWKCELEFGSNSALADPANEEFVAATRLFKVDRDTAEVYVEADGRLCLTREDPVQGGEVYRLWFWTPIIVRMDENSV